MSLNVLKTTIILLSISQFTQAWEFRLYCGSINDYKVFSPDKAGEIICDPCYNDSLPTKIETHGHQGSLDGPYFSKYLSVLTSLRNANIIGIQWADEAKLGPFVDYFVILFRALYVIAPEIADAIVIMVNKNFDLNKTSLTGLSMGAPMLAETGRILNGKGHTVNLIVACDHPSVGFEPENPTYRSLSKDCARTTFAWHTNTEKYGIERPVAHIDVYPNGGAHQPGCPTPTLTDLPFSENDLCSLVRSLEYNAEVAQNPCSIMARRVDAVDGDTKCDVICTGHIGDSTQTPCSGVYNCTTNDESPYGRGEQGL